MIKILQSDGEDGLLIGVADAACSLLGLKGEAACELEFTDEETIRRVNRENRGVDRVTDVLSFPFLQPPFSTFDAKNYPLDYDAQAGAVMLGSILICENVAARQAEAYGHSAEREKAYLFLHGLLHLLGYDHIDESDRRAMRAAEESVLAQAGITR